MHPTNLEAQGGGEMMRQNRVLTAKHHRYPDKIVNRTLAVLWDKAPPNPRLSQTTAGQGWFEGFCTCYWRALIGCFI
jgi:hypothetical protein